MTSNPLPPKQQKAGFVGLPAGPEVCIMNENGEVLKQGDEGEVCIKGESENGFPDADEAIEPIISITAKEHTTKKIVVFGMNNFINDRPDVNFVKCATERDLIEKFKEIGRASCRERV